MVAKNHVFTAYKNPNPKPHSHLASLPLKKYQIIISAYMSIQKLPVELLAEIFNNVCRLKSLCQCRLVCKSWDYIAVKSMLGRRINLETNTRVSSFVYFLSQKSDRSRFVKYLTLNSYNNEEQPLEGIFVRLLKLVFTANMVELRGKFQGPVFEEMVRIKESSALPFDQLAVIPDPTTQGANLQTYYAAALAFQESLTELVINPSFALAPYFNSFVDRLGGFKCLTWLIIDRQPINAAQLHHILSKCHCLTTLSFNFIPDNEGHLPLNASESAEWIKFTSVKNEAPLEYVDLNSDNPCPDLVEYLVAKYPKIQDIRGQTMLEHMHSLDDSHSLFRMIKPLKKAPICNILFEFFSDLPNQRIESKLQADEGHSITVAEKLARGWKQVVLKDRHTFAKGELTGFRTTKFTKRLFGPYDSPI